MESHIIIFSGNSRVWDENQSDESSRFRKIREIIITN